MITKEQAQYQIALGPEQCANCVMFHSGICDLVLGLIEPYTVCRYWEAPDDPMSVAQHVARNGVEHVETGL